jgi:tetratricopeptide (TPR) repeat protein
MTVVTPPVGAVETALEKVLSSSAFCNSPRLRRFLEFVVRYSLAGHDDRIKEYSIGVEVFDRGPRFDPRCDSIVRVEAFKLREKLLEYYSTEGATDAITVSIPKGNYRPLIQVRETPPAALLDDPQNLCVQAESLILESSPEALGRARYVLECAIERWPKNAELHVMLASAALASIEIESMAPREGIPLLRRAARRALRLDPHSGQAHFYAAVPQVIGPDKTAAMEGVSKALRAAPRSAVAHFWAASVYAADLRMRDMLIHMQLAVRLQPYALFFQTWRAVSLFWAGQPDAAIRHLRDILTVQPSDVLASHWLGQICAYIGRYDEARDAAGHAYEIAGTTETAGGLGFVEALAGRVESAEAILESLAAETRFVAGSRIAAIHAALGNLPVAASVLGRAQSQGDWHLGWARGDQRWAPLRGKLAGL